MGLVEQIQEQILNIIAQQISQHLPIVIDNLTPNQQLPTAGNILSNAVSV